MNGSAVVLMDVAVRVAMPVSEAQITREMTAEIILDDDDFFAAQRVLIRSHLRLVAEMAITHWMAS